MKRTRIIERFEKTDKSDSETIITRKTVGPGNTFRELELIGKVNELNRELQDRIADHQEDKQALKDCVDRLKDLDAWP